MPWWLECGDSGTVIKDGAIAQPIILNGSVYVRGMEGNRNVPYQCTFTESISSCSWSPLPIPHGLRCDMFGESYVLATYQGQLYWIGGEISESNNKIVPSKKIFVFDEEDGWKEDSTIPPLPIAPTISMSNNVSASSEGKYLVLAWGKNNQIKIVLYDGKEWKVSDGPVRSETTGKIDVMIHNQIVFLMDHSANRWRDSGFYKASVESLTGRWEYLKNIPYEHSNLAVFGDCLVTATENPICMLAYIPGSNRWIQLCDLNSEMLYSSLCTPAPSIIGLSCGTLLLMGKMFHDTDSVSPDPLRFPTFNVLRVTPKRKLDLL